MKVADVAWVAYIFHADNTHSGEYKEAHDTFDVACIWYMIVDGLSHILSKETHYSFENDEESKRLLFEIERCELDKKIYFKEFFVLF